MAEMVLFKSGENLAKEFPGSIFIKYGDLDANARTVIGQIKSQMGVIVCGAMFYGAAGILGNIPLIAATGYAGCMSLRAMGAKYEQGTLLQMLSTGKLKKDLPFKEIKGRYSHMIVDAKGNVLLVKEPKKGFMKRYLSNFYLARARIGEPKLKKSWVHEKIRKAQRKFLPGPGAARYLWGKVTRKRK
ncbi:MAG: hypothetical protein V1676_07525 [Candidatus Diapherotrites archaeon]